MNLTVLITGAVSALTLGSVAYPTLVAVARLATVLSTALKTGLAG